MTGEKGGRPRQLPLALPVAPRFGPDDLVEGVANAAALAHLARSDDWPGPVTLLIGPEASGKSHIAALWAARTGAPIVAACRLAEADPLALAANRAVVVEDAGPGIDERALFHLLNAVLASGTRLLLTSRAHPADWDLALPDLRSRLRAAVPFILAEPDDALLAAVLGKLFADRQTVVDPSVITFLARRMDRSYAAARALVDDLDREALASGRAITRAVAQQVLDAKYSRQPGLPGLDNSETGENNLS